MGGLCSDATKLYASDLTPAALSKEKQHLLYIFGINLVVLLSCNNIKQFVKIYCQYFKINHLK